MTVGSRENRNPAISGFPRRTWQNVDSTVVDSLILVFLKRMDLAEVSSSAEVASAWRRESFLLMPVGTFKARGNVSLPKLYLRCVWENFGTFHADTVRMVHVLLWHTCAWQVKGRLVSHCCMCFRSGDTWNRCFPIITFSFWLSCVNYGKYQFICLWEISWTVVCIVWRFRSIRYIVLRFEVILYS
jgi:hypothetical protein